MSFTVYFRVFPPGSFVIPFQLGGGSSCAQWIGAVSKGRSMSRARGPGIGAFFSARARGGACGTSRRTYAPTARIRHAGTAHACHTRNAHETRVWRHRDTTAFILMPSPGKRRRSQDAPNRVRPLYPKRTRPIRRATALRGRRRHFPARQTQPASRGLRARPMIATLERW